ncbi:MAG: hypothetical protein QM504_03985 [Pseudomonadota bacterium]
MKKIKIYSLQWVDQRYNPIFKALFFNYLCLFLFFSGVASVHAATYVQDYDIYKKTYNSGSSYCHCYAVATVSTGTAGSLGYFVERRRGWGTAVDARNRLTKKDRKSCGGCSTMMSRNKQRARSHEYARPKFVPPKNKYTKPSKNFGNPAYSNPGYSNPGYSGSSAGDPCAGILGTTTCR